VHDAALKQTPRLVEAVSAAARLSLERERLEAEVRAQLEEVRASRARIVETADAERRRLERDLHDGAQQRLVSLGLTLRLAREQLRAEAGARAAESLGRADEQLRAALAELRDLARGIHPAVLTNEGLACALEALVESSLVPVALDLGQLGTLSPAVEATAYFVASEALANVGKHAHASHIAVSVARRDRHLLVAIVDDGIGGADPALGSGLQGLQDRVAALRGNLTVHSPAGCGTRIEAEIPCEP
jgi:signal transduction histidine kinase